MAYSDTEKDDFWDIEKLIPKKASVARPFASEVHMSAVTAGGRVSSTPSDREKLTLPKGDGEENTVTYVPQGQPLIVRVTIRKHVGRYDFYDGFRKAALLYYDVHGTPCDFVPFYSYMPQYGQMTREQKNYYFWFRDAVRRGEYPRTDYSYVYLYMYEILNLPDKIPAETGVRLLATLWKTYRSALPNLDRYLSVWLQDYCLIYRLPVPMDIIGDFLPSVISASGFKEFYLSDADTAESDRLSSLMVYFSDYDWRVGKYAGGEHGAAYRMHMEHAMRPVLAEALAKETLLRSPTSLIVRDAFPNSLCTHAVKCRLEIEYHPLSRADEVRAAVTAAVKYTENKLRAALGIKSRLTVHALPDSYRQKIDRYFDDVFEKADRERRKADLPSYEKLYDAPSEVLSEHGADDIERLSWDTTFRLVSEEEAEEMRRPSVTAEEVVRQPAAPPSEPTENVLCDADIAYLSALSDGDTAAARAAVRASGAQEDGMAERINNAFLDVYGDILLENDGEEYRVIDEYREDLRTWLTKMKT